jgi:hypothetical protein
MSQSSEIVSKDPGENSPLPPEVTNGSSSNNTDDVDVTSDVALISSGRPENELNASDPITSSSRVISVESEEPLSDETLPRQPTTDEMSGVTAVLDSLAEITVTDRVPVQMVAAERTHEEPQSSLVGSDTILTSVSVNSSSGIGRQITAIHVCFSYLSCLFNSDY